MEETSTWCGQGETSHVSSVFLFSCGSSSSLPFDCEAGFGSAGFGSAAMIENSWSQSQKDYCCTTVGRGCATTALPAPIITVPPTPFPTPPPTPPPTEPARPSGPVDPFNCAVDAENTWAADKKEWCCRIHHRGCPPTPPPVQPILPPVQPTLPPRPADPYNCADGFANWQAGWSVPKKQWCCTHHGKGCPGSGGCAPVGTTSPPYNCNDG